MANIPTKNFVSSYPILSRGNEWLINGTEIRKDEIIIWKGNITIKGKLFLENVILKMDGNYTIFVEKDASLHKYFIYNCKQFYI